MSMYNGITSWTPGNEENGVANSLTVATYASRFPFGCWSYLGLGCEKKWYGTHVNKPNVNGTELLRSWWSISLKAGIVYFKSPVFWEEEKAGGTIAIHYNGSEETVELILRTTISVNQLSIYGAVADLCNELDPKFVKVRSANLWWYRLRVPTLTPHLRAQHHRHKETCCKKISRSSQNFLKIRNSRNFAKMLVLKEDWERTVLHHNWGRIWDYADSMSRIHSISKPHNIPTDRVGPVLDVKLYPHEGGHCIGIMIESLFKDRTVSRVRIVNGTNTSQKRQKK